jgi:5-methyltetrahydrofolate--homocysteine methyltransferase
MPDQPFRSRITNGDVLVADGATGTNLIARGLPSGLTAESWVMERPEMVTQLHQDFIRAGADIILTCTFNASTIRLRNSSLDGKSDQVNKRAVELAKKAVGAAQVYIAGSLGPVGQLIKPYGPLTVDEVRAAYAEQAHALTEAKVDLLVIETQFDINEVSAAVDGVRQVSNLPLVVSFSYDRGRRTMMGISPTQAARQLELLPVDVIGINCGHSLDENLQNLVELRSLTSKPIWFKPNAGLPHLDSAGKTVYDVTPEAMGTLVQSWLDAGAQIVGGCCGTSPDHLREISSHIKI